MSARDTLIICLLCTDFGASSCVTTTTTTTSTASTSTSTSTATAITSAPPVQHNNKQEVLKITLFLSFQHTTWLRNFGHKRWEESIVMWRRARGKWQWRLWEFFVVDSGGGGGALWSIARYHEIFAFALRQEEGRPQQRWYDLVAQTIAWVAAIVWCPCCHALFGIIVQKKIFKEVI